jgi:hypothetical protein
VDLVEVTTVAESEEDHDDHAAVNPQPDTRAMKESQDTSPGNRQRQEMSTFEPPKPAEPPTFTTPESAGNDGKLQPLPPVKVPTNQNELVGHLKQQNSIKSPCVEQAMKAVDRALFVPSSAGLQPYMVRISDSATNTYSNSSV